MTNPLIFKEPGCFPEFVQCCPHLSFFPKQENLQVYFTVKKMFCYSCWSLTSRDSFPASPPFHWHQCPWSDILSRKLAFKHSGKLHKDSVFFQSSVEGITFSSTERPGHDAMKKWRSAITCKVACVRILQLLRGQKYSLEVFFIFNRSIQQYRSTGRSLTPKNCNKIR